MYINAEKDLLASDRSLDSATYTHTFLYCTVTHEADFTKDKCGAKNIKESCNMSVILLRDFKWNVTTVDRSQTICK